ncbi:hypothetical protein [Methylobacterium sp. P1-11]|uniref:hypothetical protein n=1 Tax=Methylobacterium sp. P1-11 TaxID=2024616 RepID=UPI0011ED5F1F|nr:hypothetical protein [Methylobacterium sp. P1-11]
MADRKEAGMSEHLVARLEQWPSCPAGSDPFASTYVGDLMKEAATELRRVYASAVKADLQMGDGHTYAARQTLDAIMEKEPPYGV